jgi:hypothetical protein
VSQPDEIRLIVDRLDGNGLGDSYEARWEDSAGQSPPFALTPPLNVEETSRLRWYLEVYCQKPAVGDHDRAKEIKRCFSAWGERLFGAVFGFPGSAQYPYYQKLTRGAGTAQRPLFTIASTHAEILCQPWEMLRDTAHRALVLQGVTLRRQLWQKPNGTGKGVDDVEPPPLRLPLRVLLVVSRPEGLGDPDSRSSQTTLHLLPAKAVTLRVCEPRLAKLRARLKEAADRRERFDVFHFDGHGNFHPASGEGVLYFERENREPDGVDSARLGDLLARYQIPLVLLEACRSADLSGGKPVFGSIAPSLLSYGVSNVVGFSHQIHVEAARRLVEPFYLELAAGKSVGQALASSRECLHDTPYRRIDHGVHPEEVALEDWFVPQLYQFGPDPVPAANPPKTVTISFKEPLQQLGEQALRSLRSAVADTLRIPPEAFEIDVTEWEDD